jgi:glycoprotein 6-alpha-L-fucosyltransferase
MSFSRQILIFICIWGLLAYFFLTKLNTSSTSRESEEIERLNLALSQLEQSKTIDVELRKLLDEYVNDLATAEQKSELLKRINSKFDDSVINPVTVGGKRGTPSLEYEQLRRRVATNVGELWNHLQAELSKVENIMKNQFDAQQALKVLTNFLDLTKEHKR